MKKKTKKQAPEQIAPDSDEHFTYIVGYTSGGVPYGVTWVEMEAAEHSAAVPRTSTPLSQNEPVSLNEIAQEWGGKQDYLAGMMHQDGRRAGCGAWKQ